MSIRIKHRPNSKAVIRFGNQMEIQWFNNMFRSIRDSDPKKHPMISIKDTNGEELEPMPMPPMRAKPEVVKGDVKMAVKKTEAVKK